MSDALIIEESNVEEAAWSDEVRGQVSFRTIFGAQSRTPEFTAGVTDLPPGGWLGHHRRSPAEIYYVMDGEGALFIDGDEYGVAAGTAVYIPGNAEHAILNTGDSLLRFFYTFALGGSFDQIEYHFTAER